MSQDQDTGCVSLYATCESQEIASHLATTLVNERLVACVNMQEGTRSVYEWDGILQLDAEVTMVMKTTAARADAAVTRIMEMHNYDTPCITVHPIIGGNPKYLAWVKKQVEG